MFSVGDRFELHIDRLSVGGRGVGRKDGIVVFVDLVAPLETVEVEITHVKKNLAEAKLVRVIEQSPHRIDPPCVHFTEGCGGCSWQHISYDGQLNAKRDLVSEAIRKFSGFREVTLGPTVPSPLQFRYRNRIQVHVESSTDKNGNGLTSRVGFRARSSHRIVDVKDCLITEEPLVEKIDEIRRGKVHGDRIQIYRNLQNEVLVESADEQSSLAFSQVNSSQNAQLIHAVIDQVKKSGSAASVSGGQVAAVLDLYSGSGNFTFPLAAVFPDSRVTGVELNSPAVQRGNELAKQQGKNVRFERAKVEDFLKRWNPPTGQYLILIDPPRTGCDPAAIKILKDLKPTCLVYVSCHPVTLARDLKPFADSGWTIEFAQPFDMFPQTDHVETVVTLKPPHVVRR